MSETTIYLVYGYDLYEMPCKPVDAFADEADAKAFVERCRAHHEKKPEWPSYDAADAEIEAAQKVRDRWAKKHPAAGQENRDGFTYMPVKLHAKENASGR